MSDMTRIDVVFHNADGNPVSHYSVTGDMVTLERPPVNDDEGWRHLARWIVVNRPQALADALDDVADQITDTEEESIP